MHGKLVHIVAYDWKKTDAVRNKFVVEHGGVLAYLDQVNRHNSDFADDDSAQGVRH